MNKNALKVGTGSAALPVGRALEEVKSTIDHDDDDEWAHDDDSDGFSDDGDGHRAGIRPSKAPKQMKRPKVNFTYTCKVIDTSANVGIRLTSLALKGLGSAKSEFAVTINERGDFGEQDDINNDDANLEMQPLWGIQKS